MNASKDWLPIWLCVTLAEHVVPTGHAANSAPFVPRWLVIKYGVCPAVRSPVAVRVTGAPTRVPCTLAASQTAGPPPPSGTAGVAGGPAGPPAEPHTHGAGGAHGA